MLKFILSRFESSWPNQPKDRKESTFFGGLLALAAHTPAAPPSCFFIRQGGPAFPRRALARGASL